MWIKYFPPYERISIDCIPYNLLISPIFDLNKHYNIVFGLYTKSQKFLYPPAKYDTQNISAMALFPVGNIQGTYKWLNLNMVQCIHHKKFTHLPIPTIIVRQVETLA